MMGFGASASPTAALVNQAPTGLGPDGLRSTGGTGLTPLQDKLLRFIEDSLENSRVSPSFESMKAYMGAGMSKSGIHRLVLALEERGYITRRPGKVRSIGLANPLAKVPAFELMAELRARGIPVKVDTL